MRIAVTGASGRIGREVARLLAPVAGGAEQNPGGAELAPGGAELNPAGADRIDLRLVVRDPARAPQVPGAEVAVASFSDAAACRDAFTGVDALLMVSAGESADRIQQHRTAIAAAAEAGVGHVVYTSFLGAAEDAVFTLARDHGTTEALLRDSGLTWTFLRDSFYADVLLDFAGQDRVIRGPGGDGRCGFVARADVAAVAAEILRDPAPWANQALDLTGPEALSLEQAAQLMSRARGEEYRYVEETLEQARASRAHYGAPDWQVEAWISTYTAIASGALDVVSDAVQEVLGRPATPAVEVFAAPL